MDVDTVIDRIGFGLPENFREKIDRENLENITDLFSELKKHEGKIGKKNLKTKETKQEWRYKNEEKKPCKTCENLNKGARYHPEDKCWFKTKPNITKERPKTMDSIRDLYELLLQKEALEDRLGVHQVTRKSNRTPSLRLRFGRRSDPNMLASPYLMAQESSDRSEN
ncbi:hypothetical protein QE152_g37241 [Popillia japonica]|uniref:Uncharacterized protein n=1 Tax=Popillia japonica TaxID=7064 RepID=A0AAW1IAV0_POPJA